MRKFIVLKPVTLGYGSHVRQPTPSRFVTQEKGTILSLDSEAPNGNVWFFDEDGKRGKIECGEVANLTKDGRLVEIE